MPKLKVSQEQALKFLNKVPHKRFSNAIESHWKIDQAGHVTAQSVCWLFCWGKTGMGSVAAATAASNVFDAVLDISFSKLDAKIKHDWVRRVRYDTNSKKAELELDGFLR